MMADMDLQCKVHISPRIIPEGIIIKAKTVPYFPLYIDLSVSVTKNVKPILYESKHLID